MPDSLKPYEFHGIDFNFREGDKEATAECPFCGREGKFSVDIETGKWRCLVCDLTGNIYTFLRKYWKLCDEQTTMEDSDRLAEDRKLEYTETPMIWGAVVSILTREWMLPGYNPEGKLCQLYRYGNTPTGKTLKATTGLNHQIHYAGVADLKNALTIYVCEGPWDGMALWEILQKCKETEEGLKQTANRKASLAAEAEVIALPGVGAVGKPLKRFLPLFAGKTVNLMFDSDHPREHPKTGIMQEPAGLGGMRRAAEILSQAPEPPEEINYLKWSEKGFDPDKPSGFDIRDAFSS